MIPGSANPLLLKSAAAAGGYQIERSLRFSSNDSAYLSRTPAVAGNRKTWTWAGWVKRSALGSGLICLADAKTGANESPIMFNEGPQDTLSFYQYIGGFNWQLRTTQVFRDVGAWFHLVVAVDTTQATAANRIKIYLNGSEITTFAIASYPSQNSDTSYNSTNIHTIGAKAFINSYFDGYLADIHFIDGQALTPSSFTEVSATTGQLIPIEYTGTYGLVSVAAATGALPIFNTTDTYGAVKGTGTRTDTNSASIAFALPMDGTNGGTSFGDQSAVIRGSGSAKTVTVTGNTNTSTAQSKFYGSSGYFDGTGDYLQTPYATDFNFGSGDFTIETFVNISALGTAKMIANYIAPTAVTGNDLGWIFDINTSNQLEGVLYNGSSAVGLIQSGSLVTGKWYHAAYVRSGTNFYMFLDGVLIGTATGSAAHNVNTGWNISIGYGHSAGTQFMNGYLQDLRIYKGAAKYTSNFTPVVSLVNSFQLKFADNSSNTAATLGKDTSGNGNNWTPNNFVATPAVRQGYNGGVSYQYGAGNAGGGGGGGAGAVGSPAVSGVTAGAGGNGRLSSITGSSTYYGGGGGGGSWGTAGGAGGLGGGGAGKLGGSSTGPANPGTNGLGGGGGGAGYASADWQAGGAGGSGRVIIRYPLSYGTLASSGGGSQTTVGSDYVYQWTSVGSVSITFPSTGTIPAQYLVLGGGGGAESGGGGGGGVLEGTINMSGGSSQTITVGAGGAGATPYPSAGAAANGGNSVFASIVALGGGRGGGGDSNAAATSGGSGGGGGGSSSVTIPAGAGTGDNQSDIDSLVDTPTSYGTDTSGVGGVVRGNYATINPLQIDALTATLANGNLDYSTATASGDYPDRFATIGVSSGKWYAEATINTIGSSSAIFLGAAIDPPYSLNYLGATSTSWGYYSLNGQKFNNNSSSSYGSSFAAGDVIGIALDLTAGTMVFYKNGVSQGTAYSSLPTGTYFIGISGTGTTSASMNFGQRPFAYTAPSGFKALCDTNLPAPVVAKPNTAMDVLLWSGTGGNRSFSSLNMSPDFVWIKQRNQAFSTGHQLYDIVRGAGSDKELNSAGTAAEGAGNIDQYGWLSSFDSNGFSVTAGPIGADYVNASGTTYVAWAWDAGTSTVTNTQGSITSQVRANASAGFSVVTWTGDGAVEKTVGHGLGVAPKFYIVKRRNSTSDWVSFLTNMIPGFNPQPYINLNGTAAASLASQPLPTSNVFYVQSVFDNINTGTYVAYCFAPVVGYSSMGSYVGNGSADGPFVYTGFRPRWIMVKCVDSAQNWFMLDTARNTYNAVNSYLMANSSSAEDANNSTVNTDFTSNGFKVRATTSNLNNNAQNYVFAAFAESPLQYARAR